ncbi:hypothetical protein Patl1_03293 [Pistacia atlantica]|uniref:Uncharacterized protein n=1 Tax=Pistacia atlantica TaxID=434234 RepID=A0ACC1CC97_9ROSI|nr:hypothetical protein Patl1_03293 [Pistacia atlantica]
MFPVLIKSILCIEDWRTGKCSFVEKEFSQKLFVENQILDKASAGTKRLKRHTCELLNNEEPDQTNRGLDQSHERQDLQGKEPQHRSLLHDLQPCSLQALHKLVSLVHDHVNVSDLGQPVVSTSTSNSELNVKDKYGKIMTTKLFCLEDDPVAKILWTLEAHAFQEVSFAMAVSFYILFSIHITASC